MKVSIAIIVISLLSLSLYAQSPAPTAPTGIKGLSSKTIAVGSGESVGIGSLINVKYIGKLKATGVAFDSTATAPFEFVLGAGAVIKGWDLGIVGMSVGEKRELTIEPELGYGSRNLGVIPPNSTLIYEIELVSFNKPLKGDAFPDVAQLQWKRPTAGIKVATVSEGTGSTISAGSKVEIHYTGWLKGGTRFESSKDAMKPLVFEVGSGRAIKAWDLGLVGLREGGSYYLHAEPQVAYGSTAYAKIPPNAELIFKIEVLKVTATKLPFADVIWKTSPEGFEYSIQQEGSGAPAQPGKTVVVHYTGWLLNGTKFDSSVDRNQPFSFPLGMGRVIRGWDLGVTGMKPGEKKMLKIPGHLAYGDRGAGGTIPPDATLIFAVELIEVK